MDVADYEFARISEFDMELKLFETTLQRGKKRSADEGTADHGAVVEKKARMAGPVKIGREAAAKYWQSLIDAGRDLGTRRTEEMKEEAIYTPPSYLRSLKLKVRASTTPTSNKAFIASMRAKVNLVAQAQSTSSTQDTKFKCTHCDNPIASVNFHEKIDLLLSTNVEHWCLQNFHNQDFTWSAHSSKTCGTMKE